MPSQWRSLRPRNHSPQADPGAALAREIDRRAAQLEAKAVAWRRDIHQHPELSNREVRTSKLAADHLRSLGIEVRTGRAKTGVVGLLRGGRPGPVVALRADMDAPPSRKRSTCPSRPPCVRRSMVRTSASCTRADTMRTLRS